LSWLAAECSSDQHVLRKFFHTCSADLPLQTEACLAAEADAKEASLYDPETSGSFGEAWEGDDDDDAAPAPVLAPRKSAGLVEVFTAFGSRRLGKLLVGRKARDWVGEDLTAFGSRRIGQLVAGRRWKEPSVHGWPRGAAASLLASLLAKLSTAPRPLAAPPASPAAGDLAISDPLEEQAGCSFRAYDREDLWFSDMLPAASTPRASGVSVRNLLDLDASGPKNAELDGGAAFLTELT